MTAAIHEQAARTAKAMKLIAAVSGFAARYGLDAASTARLATASDRALIAQLAGVNAPSDETWTVVVDSLAQAKAIEAQVTGYDSLTGVR